MLALERLYQDFNFKIIPIVIGATGHITKNLRKHLIELGIKEENSRALISRLQERAIMGTVKIVLLALRNATKNTTK